MLFNSFIYILLFLPLVFGIYFFLNSKNLTILARAWLVLASLFFYGFWKVAYLTIMIFSILVNYGFGFLLIKNLSHKTRKILIYLGIIFNLALLGFYKYTDFLIGNINYFLHDSIPLLQITLPLGISFFTFTQIAYLVDTYKRKVKESNLLHYSLFVTYFPHLLAGPILHHSEMMPQFYSMRTKVLKYENVFVGLFLFSIGLFKKTVIADTFAVWATYGFDEASTLSFLQAWVSSLSYSLQLYFDFSGYTDMAVGGSLLFNIKLPINFNSPYKALGIQDFWRRWHITLSRFLRDYVYIPCGGNKGSELHVYFNLMITFLIGGLWHGAGWTFILWGALHGIALVTQRIWQKLNINLPNYVYWFLTFNFVNFAWVFFRAKSWGDAIKVGKGMLNFSDFGSMLSANPVQLSAIIVGLIIVIFCKNSNELTLKVPYYRFAPVIMACIFITSIVILNIRGGSVFIYFQF